MKRIIFVIILLTGTAFAQIDYARDGFAPLVPPVQNNHTYSNKQYKNINRYEKRIFNRTFEYDSIPNRISRLEEQIMGTIQSGDINTRYSNLQRAISHYNPAVNYSDLGPYCGIPVMSGSGWRGLAGSLGNFFSNMYGTPTGMSPQIYSPYINDYGPDYQVGTYSNPGGWANHNTYYGSGSGVHIID